MYRYVQLFSHTTHFSFAKAVSMLRKAEGVTPDLDRVQFITSKALTYPTTRRGSNGQVIRTALRDQTQNLMEFETTAF